MENFDLPIYHNQLKTKKDLEEFVLDLLSPLENTFIRNSTRLHIGNTSSGAPDEVSQMEGFSRIIWGLVGLNSEKKDSKYWKLIRQGLINGTDPKHPDYFGEVQDYDQRIVEMAAIGFAFVLKPECIYEPLTQDQKNKLIVWLNLINEREAHGCNWKFFRVMVNVGLKQLGLAYNEDKTNSYLDELDTYYMGHGWYRDGNIEETHADYYVPFAMHYYGLFYSVYMKEVDPIRSEIYRKRATLFANDFVYWFASNGEAIPYGRSLTYRFAQVAFWSMIVVAKVETSFSLGQIKGLILRHLRWWNQLPIYDRGGFLTIGYAYENLFMGEDYNAPGSVYWALKTMLITLLDEEDNFWSAEEEEMISLEPFKVQEAPGLVIARDSKNKHVLAYNGGHLHTNGHIHVECKYEKFVYSTVFGFSVPRSHRRLAFGAYDSTLAVSKDGMYYRHKDQSSIISLSEKLIMCQWKPFEETDIRTYLILGHPWHIRIHIIKTTQKIYTAEGGFAIGIESLQGKNLEYRLNELHGSNGDKNIHSSLCTTNEAYSYISDLTMNQKVELLKAASNTNIMKSRTVIPTLMGEVNSGVTIIASYIAGDLLDFESDFDSHKYLINKRPSVRITNQTITIIDEYNKVIESINYERNHQR